MEYVDYLIYLEQIPPQLKFPIVLGVWVVTLATVVLFLSKIFTKPSDNILETSQSEEELRQDVRKFLQPDGAEEFSLLERQKTPPRIRTDQPFLRSCPQVSIEGIENQKLQDLILKVDSSIDRWEQNDRLIRAKSKIFQDMGEKIIRKQKRLFSKAWKNKIRFDGKNISSNSSTLFSQSPIVKKTPKSSNTESKDSELDLHEVLGKFNDRLKGNEKADKKLTSETNDGFVIEGLGDDDNNDNDDDFGFGDGKLELPKIFNNSLPLTENKDEKEINEEGDSDDFGLDLNINGGGQLAFPKVTEEESDDDDDDFGVGEDDPFSNIDFKGFEKKTNARKFSDEETKFLNEAYSEISNKE